MYATKYQNQKYKNLDKNQRLKANIDLIKELNKKTEKTEKKEIQFLKYAVIPSNKIKSNIIPFDKLSEQHILKAGFENPILIKTTNNEIEFVGLSEKDLSIAKKHNLLIPTIVIDESNLFNDSYTISSITHLKQFVKNRDDFAFIENYILKNVVVNEFDISVESNSIEQLMEKSKRFEVDNYYTNTSKSKLKYATKHNLP